MRRLTVLGLSVGIIAALVLVLARDQIIDVFLDVDETYDDDDDGGYLGRYLGWSG